MNKSNPSTTPAKTDDEKAAAAKNTPLQPKETAKESALQSIANAITAPMRDAAEDEERKQVGQPR